MTTSKEPQNSFTDLPDWLLQKWQEIADLLAGILDVKAALIMKIENEFMEVFLSSHSSGNPYQVGAKEKWYGLYCETVIKTQQRLLIPNASLDQDWDKNPDIKLGMIAYLGFPINFPDNQPFGTLCVLDDQEKHFSPQQEKLLQQFKNVLELDLALAQSFDIHTQKLAKTIQEQVKKLQCLYAVSTLVAELGRSIDEILKSVVDLIPSGCQVSDESCVKLVYAGREFTSSNFRNTGWKQSAEIKALGETVGTVTIFYQGENPGPDDNEFLLEERNMLLDIARQLGLMLERHRAEDRLKTAYTKLEALWSVASLTGADLAKISDSILTSITRMSESEYGFYGFVDETETVITIYSWSEQVLKDCAIADKPQQYLIREAGVWAEALRRREPFILDDYNGAPLAKKDLPAGHVHLTNLLVVPYLSRGRVVTVAAVANRSVAYAQPDINQIVAFLGSIQAIVERKQAEEALRASEERFRTVADFTFDWEYWQALDGRLLYLSPSCERLSGYPASAFLADANLLISIVYPDDLERWLDHANHPPASRPAEIDFRILRRDGEIRWIAHVCQPVFNVQGEPAGIRASNRDITERKQAEAQIHSALMEKQMLLRELNHRTKNNLNIIIALIEQQAETSDNQQFQTMATILESRLRSISQVHEMLYRSPDLSQINLAEYAQELVANLASGFSLSPEQVDVELDAMPVMVGINSAIPCGQIMNELLSNAFKYAFPNGRRGQIRIQIRQAQDGEIYIRIVDDGAGFPPDYEARASNSLGMMLVHLLVQQLNGRVTVDGTHGVSCEITFHEKS